MGQRNRSERLHRPARRPRIAERMGGDWHRRPDRFPGQLVEFRPCSERAEEPDHGVFERHLRSYRDE